MRLANRCHPKCVRGSALHDDTVGSELRWSPFMCGIFGILAANCSISRARWSARRLAGHRGPDDRGTVVIQAGTSPGLEVGLGSRRLAILDLSPRASAHAGCGKPAIGLSTRRNLQLSRKSGRAWRAKECAFVSRSDTEVLLKSVWPLGRTLPGGAAGDVRICDLGCEKQARLLLAAIPWHQALYYCSVGPYSCSLRNSEPCWAPGCAPPPGSRWFD